MIRLAVPVFRGQFPAEAIMPRTELVTKLKIFLISKGKDEAKMTTETTATRIEYSTAAAPSSSLKNPKRLEAETTYI
jgi:hypothetical protein